MSHSWKGLIALGALYCCMAIPTITTAQSAQLDQVILGDTASEKAHDLMAEHSEVITGALDEPARRLLPLQPQSWDGGSVSFTMKIDPGQQNYFTARFWGSDKGEKSGRLLLWADGLQVGYRHEGDYDVLNQCDEQGEAPGRFFYQTLPLPLSLTHGKTTIKLKISALGPMWPYGQTFDKYQKTLSEPSRGIYRVYTHTQAYFVPDPTEKQGHFPDATLRTQPGEEVIAQSKQVVINRLKRMLQEKVTPESAWGKHDRLTRLKLLAAAYNTEWTPAYHDPRTIEQIVQYGDAAVRDFAENPDQVAANWVGAGPLGEAVMQTNEAIKPRLDETIDIGGSKRSRREAWAKQLRGSVDYWRTHRRSYTNQSMIVDWNIYMANRALEIIQPKLALPEAKTMGYLYQAIGIEPWLGSDPREDGAHVADTPDQGTVKPFGENYNLVTRKGLSRELGWVGTYGETILHFTGEMARMTHDPKIRQQLVKMQHARLYFRYPGLDGDGYRCMKLVSEIDNRTAHYPLSGSAYVSPKIREAWWMDVPALLSNDQTIVGAAQRSIADGQYFAYAQGRLKDPDTLGMMRNVDEYTKVKSLPLSNYEFPMADGQPDFAFADEEDGVVAIKHGDTRLYVNLYYRAERAVNSVARVFESTPTLTRIATVCTQARAVPSGQTYTRPDWIDMTRSRALPPPGQTIHQAWAGQEMPISARPEGARLPAYGDWGPFLGKAQSYELQFGHYLIVMNCSKDKPLTWTLPPQFAGEQDLISKRPSSELGTSLAPLSTIVLVTGIPDH